MTKFRKGHKYFPIKENKTYCWTCGRDLVVSAKKFKSQDRFFCSKKCEAKAR